MTSKETEYTCEEVVLGNRKDASFSGMQTASSHGFTSKGGKIANQLSSSSSLSAKKAKQGLSLSTAAINRSKMQASFAERTATEMEEIVNWYKKYEGEERLKKTNQQSQSMPDNAFIVDDFEDDAANDDANYSGGDCPEQLYDTNCNSFIGVDEEPLHEKLIINDDESVVVKDYYTPIQRARKVATPRTSSLTKKSPRSFFSSAVGSVTRSISKRDTNENSECANVPPRDIKIVITDDDESSVISSITTPHFERRKLPQYLPIADGALEGDKSLLCDIKTVEEVDAEFREKEEEVLSMLSPPKNEQRSRSPVETSDNYRDEEKEVLAMLSSTSAECCASTQSQNDAGANHTETTFDSTSGKGSRVASTVISNCETTKQQAHTQIEAADDLIRRTKEMAEIIAQLPDSSSSSSNDLGSDDGNNDIVDVYNTSNGDILANSSVTAFETPSLSSEMKPPIQLEWNLENSCTDHSIQSKAGIGMQRENTVDGSEENLPNQESKGMILGIQPRRYVPYVVPITSMIVGWVMTQ